MAQERVVETEIAIRRGEQEAISSWIGFELGEATAKYINRSGSWEETRNNRREFAYKLAEKITPGTSMQVAASCDAIEALLIAFDAKLESISNTASEALL